MDFELGGDQQAVAEAVDELLARHAGPERAVLLAAKAEYDGELERALREAGFLALFAEAGPLAAALLVEATARAGGVLSIAAAALVAPALLDGRVLDGPVALASLGGDGPLPPVRFAPHARHVIVAAGSEARLVPLEAGEAEPVRSTFGYPFGRLPESLATRGEGLGAGSGDRLRCWWRTALAVETAGTLRAALDVTLGHVKARRQFGRAIGSFQGVQHRLAQAHVRVEGARWLALEAADRGAEREGAALAAAHASAAAKSIFDETHQFSGAMGFTREHPLHVWSMRLQALRLELGGAPAHRRAAAAARWRAAR